MTWGADGWLRTTDGDGIPHQRGAGACRADATAASPARARGLRRETRCRSHFQWLRSPWPDELFSLRARTGHLRLYGRETIGSLFRQALVARRQQAHCFSAATIVEFDPEHFQQMAGLVCYYNSAKFHYLYLSRDDGRQAPPRDVGDSGLGLGGRVHAADSVPSGAAVDLRVEVDFERLHFAYRIGGRSVAVAAAAVRRQHPL